MSIDVTKIRIMLAEKNLNMKEFCLDKNIPYSTFTQILNGTRIPNLKTIGKIADALGVEASELIRSEQD